MKQQHEWWLKHLQLMPNPYQNQHSILSKLKSQSKLNVPIKSLVKSPLNPIIYHHKITMKILKCFFPKFQHRNINHLKSCYINLDHGNLYRNLTWDILGYSFGHPVSKSHLHRLRPFRHQQHLRPRRRRPLHCLEQRQRLDQDVQRSTGGHVEQRWSGACPKHWEISRSKKGTITPWWTYKKQWKDPPFLMGQSTISMAIFCYVSSPEGIQIEWSLDDIFPWMIDDREHYGEVYRNHWRFWD